MKLATNTSGLRTSAPTIATRCRCPPDKCPRFAVQQWCDPQHLSHFIHRHRGLRLGHAMHLKTKVLCPTVKFGESA